jgi:hypothetical protein
VVWDWNGDILIMLSGKGSPRRLIRVMVFITERRCEKFGHLPIFCE